MTVDLRSESKSDKSNGSDNKIKPATKSDKLLPVVEQGPNGELCAWCQETSTFEFWVWGCPAIISNYKKPYGDSCSNNEKTDKEVERTTESLLLFLKTRVSPRSVYGMCFMPMLHGTVFISACSDEMGPFLEARDNGNVIRYNLPSVFVAARVSSLKVSSLFIVVLSSKGHLYVLQYKQKILEDSSYSEGGKFIPANENGSLLLIYNHCTIPIVNDESLQGIKSQEILLKTSTFDSSAVFDIVGNWLVYAPDRTEIDYFKRLQVSNDSSANGRTDKKSAAKSMFTPVKLPLGNPLLMKMVSSLSNNAFDKLYKLSQYGTKKFRNYMSSSSKIIDKDVSLHSISNSIGKALYSTATKLKKQALSSGANEYIKIMDLSNGRILATFKPPGGISYLSLSPYDLHLIHASYRGDNFYMWDLYKLPKEVSLIEKFARGKTSAKTKEIVWFVNDENTNVLPGTNSGFGCITKESGSLHWYNINYLFCGNETNNYPNLIDTGLAQKSPPNGQFLDLWILPSNKALRFFKLPRLSNLNNFDSSDNTEQMLRSINQLSFLDSDGCLRLLSPLNGKHTCKYVLPYQEKKKDEEDSGNSNGNSQDLEENLENQVPNFTSLSNIGTARKFDIPLSQTEIETAAPFMSLIKNRKVEISYYDFGEDADPDLFFKEFSTFGNDIPTVQQRVAKDSGTNTPMHASGTMAIEGGLELHVEDEFID